MSMTDDQEPMTPNLDGLRKNWLQRGKQGNLNAHVVELMRFHRGEAGILHRGAHSAPGDSLAQRFVGLGDSNTSLQAAPHVKGDENPAPLRKNSFSGYGVRKFTTQDTILDGFAG